MFISTLCDFWIEHEIISSIVRSSHSSYESTQMPSCSSEKMLINDAMWESIASLRMKFSTMIGFVVRFNSDSSDEWRMPAIKSLSSVRKSSSDFASFSRCRFCGCFSSAGLSKYGNGKSSSFGADWCWLLFNVLDKLKSKSSITMLSEESLFRCILRWSLLLDGLIAFGSFLEFSFRSCLLDANEACMLDLFLW